MTEENYNSRAAREAYRQRYQRATESSNNMGAHARADHSREQKDYSGAAARARARHAAQAQQAQQEQVRDAAARQAQAQATSDPRELRARYQATSSGAKQSAVPAQQAGRQAARSNQGTDEPAQQMGEQTRRASSQPGTARRQAPRTNTPQSMVYDPRSRRAMAQPDSFAAVAPASAPFDGGKEAAEKHKKRRRIALGIGGGVLGLILIAGIALFVYANILGNKMKLENLDDVMSVLSTHSDEEPFYILVIGSDNWEDYGARSDAMVLCRIDLENAVVTMVSVPRDTPYQINGETVKLNAVFAEEGEAACVEAVSQLTGVPISHYVELEFDQLQEVVDAIGGVTVNVPYTIDYTVYTKDQETVHIDKGKQTLTGEQAIALARMRTASAYLATGMSTDAIRQANIRAMMVGVVKQVLSLPANEIPGQVATLAGMVKTDIEVSTIVNWAVKLAQADDVTMYSCTGPTEGEVDEASGMWLAYEAPDQWAKLMAVVDAGGDPSNVLDDQSSSDGAVDLTTTDTATTSNASNTNTNSAA